MASKIKIKIGPMEIEYEGEENFLKNELPALLDKISTVFASGDLLLTPEQPERLSDNSTDNSQKPSSRKKAATRKKRPTAKKTGKPRRAVTSEKKAKKTTTARKSGRPAKAKKKPQPQDSTAESVANKLKPKSGKELILAASASLAIKKGQDVFEKKVLRKEMRNTGRHFKKSYNTNLSHYLKQLLKEGKLIEQAKDRFALEPQTKGELQKEIV